MIFLNDLFSKKTNEIDENLTIIFRKNEIFFLTIKIGRSWTMNEQTEKKWNGPISKYIITLLVGLHCSLFSTQWWWDSYCLLF